MPPKTTLYILHPTLTFNTPDPLHLRTQPLNTMPSVPQGKILVTGCNGYVAVWVVKQLLEGGYAVRGTVRRASAIVYLQKLFESYGPRFEVVIVPDITKVRRHRLNLR